MPASPTVLVPIRILEGESLPDGIPELLSNAEVVLLGYHEIPEQTAPGQARLQFEERATRNLDKLTVLLEQAGASVRHHLVFTHDEEKTIDRIATEENCLATLVPSAVGTLEHVLVAVRGTVGTDRLTRLVTGLFAESDVEVELFHVAEAGEADADVQTLLDGLTDRFVENGIDESRIASRSARDVDPTDAIADAAVDVDVIVMGESDPTLSTLVFGLPTEQVAERFLGPVLVVRRGSSA